MDIKTLEDIDNIATDIAVMRGSQERRNAIIKLVNQLKQPETISSKKVSSLEELKLKIDNLLVVPHGNYPVIKSDLYYCDFLKCYHNGKTKPNGEEVTIQQDCCFAVITNRLSEEDIDFILKTQPKVVPKNYQADAQIV